MGCANLVINLNSMDEITLVNLLNKICEKDATLKWNLSCKYHDGLDSSIMQIGLTDQHTRSCSKLTFHMASGKLLSGKFKNIDRFQRDTEITDALLDILSFIQSRRSEVLIEK